MSDRAAESLASGRSSGAFLLVPRAARLAIALPVPRQACLGLARAVLAAAGASHRDATAPDSPAPGNADPDAVLSGLLRSLSGNDPAVAVWLASWERDDSRRPAAACGGGVRGSSLWSASPERVRPPSLLGRFGESLVVSGVGPTGDGGVACVGQADWDAFVARSDVVSAGGRSSPDRAVAWLERLDRCGRAGAAGTGSTPGAMTDGEWSAGAVSAGRFTASPEALVLRDAVGRAVASTEEASRFAAAVAEARLEAMRELAYGAGHEINNPLANIATRAQALLLDEADAERRRRLSTIVDQAFRARDMIGGLMLFARPPKSQPAAADAGVIVAAAVELGRPAAAAKGASIMLSPAESPIEVVVDRVQIEEAVRGIVVNAIEAVDNGGEIGVAVRRHQGPDGASCRITVVDGGRGMDAETIRRAFDPFFSGREAGRGAGLGLSKAWRLIEASGGDVVLESRPGHGTQVTILLPLAR